MQISSEENITGQQTPSEKNRIAKRKKFVYNLRKVNNSPGLYSIVFLKHVFMNNYNVTDILLRKIQNST